MMTTYKLTETARRNLETAHSFDPDDIQCEIDAGNYGDLMDYDTADRVRAATLEEAIESLESDPTGAFRGADGKTYYVAW